VVLFHRSFGEIKISSSTLLKLYRSRGIKRNTLRYVKTLRFQDPEKRQTYIVNMIEQIKDAKARGKRIIFADEAVFTTATLPDRAYAAKKDNVTLEEKLCSSPEVAVVAGVSAERGLEAHYLHTKSIDSDSFI